MGWNEPTIVDLSNSHDFGLIKKLVYPDGTIPKCQHFALPTRDCLFKNPLFDKQTILKIWNFNKYGRVIGAFNCQGAGWDPKEQTIKGYSECYKPMFGSVHVTDMEWDQKIEFSEMGMADEYVVYLNQAEELRTLMLESAPMQVTLKPSSFELFSIMPIEKLGPRIKFAPIGLTNMFNSGGSIQELLCVRSGTKTSVKMEVKGEGTFLAYLNLCPNKALVNGIEMGFELTLDLTWHERTGGVSEVVFLY